jgi:N-acetyl-gamma-glutamyl-phosphate reductase common form
MSDKKIPAVVLGGTGYVAGDLLRLLVMHPHLQVAGVMSESQAGTLIRDVFPQLQNCLGNQKFVSKKELLSSLPAGSCALFSAAPHGASAALVAEFLEQAQKSATHLTVVDVSADFRYQEASAYEAVYGQPHGAPELLPAFASALPEHLSHADQPHIGHPGCFATALLLAAVPLLELDLTDGHLHAVGITGSTGSGRSLSPATHHPERQSNLFAYKPLAHRHAPEVMAICENLTGTRPNLHFIPHSGPFARGIHMTMQARLKKTVSEEEIRKALTRFYESSEFVIVRDSTPRIKDVAGSNYAHLGVACDEDSVAVFVVIDNLVKGAAGGALQWMNRKLGFAENAGLTAPAAAWI